MNGSDAQSALLKIQDWPERARLAHYRVQELARICRVRQRTLERFFHDHFIRTPRDWLEELHQAEVERLLVSNKPLKEVSYLAGYKQPSHMTKRFLDYHGMTPSEWRQEHPATIRSAPPEHLPKVKSLVAFA